MLRTRFGRSRCPPHCPDHATGGTTAGRQDGRSGGFRHLHLDGRHRNTDPDFGVAEHGNSTDPTAEHITTTPDTDGASSSSYRPQPFLGSALVLAATAALASTVTRLRRLRRRPRASDIDVHLDYRACSAEVVAEQPSSRPLIRMAAEATAPTGTLTEEPQ